MQRGSCAAKGRRIALACVGLCACGARAPLWIRGDTVAIPRGSFTMGSADADANRNEQPVHRVHVAAFRLDRTEVTVKAYGECVRAGKCREPEAFVEEKGNYRIFCNWRHPEGRAMHPVNCVDFFQASAFCAWAGKRLPTEEEWEYVASGGEGRKFPWGNDEPSPTRLNACASECPANLGAKRFPLQTPLFAASDGWPETAPAGSYPAGASRHGVLDLAGNVWEWTMSFYAAYDGSNREAKRVLRGGSWGGGDARTLRTTNRFRLDEEGRGQFLGFRCAK